MFLKRSDSERELGVNLRRVSTPKDPLVLVPDTLGMGRRLLLYSIALRRRP